MLVILDPGHAGQVPGKCSPDRELREYKWAREITSRLEKRLEELGIEHVRSTPASEDEGPEPGLTKRCNRANEAAKKHSGKSVFVSVHINAAGADSKWHNASGWSVFVSPKASTNSKNLATYMTEAAKESGIKVRVPAPEVPYWIGNFTVVNKTNMPAVLVENMFQDNQADKVYLMSEEGKKTLTEIMIQGICKYFGVTYK